MYSTPESPNVKHCEWCGNELAPKKLRFCNKKCNSAWRSANYRISDIYICKQCGIEFRPKAKNRTEFHSRECAFAYRARLKVERANRLEEDRRVVLRACEVCGEPVSRINAKTCGRDECKKERDRKTSRQYNAGKRIAQPRVCKMCGEILTPEYGNKRRLICGRSECISKYRRLHKGRKHNKSFGARARKILREQYGSEWRKHYESVNRRKVFRRDGWRCQLCGCKIKETKQWHERQATVDHIVPLVQGGEHKYTNVQAACMMCNSKKSGRASGQMRLLG